MVSKVKMLSLMKSLFKSIAPVGVSLAICLSAAMPGHAAEMFNDLQCQIDFVEKDLCNVSFFRKYLSVKLIKSGAAQRFQFRNLVRWSYENASLRKRATLLTTRVEHIHIFTLVFNDPDVGGYSTVIIDFDDIANVPPMKALLGELAPQG